MGFSFQRARAAPAPFRLKRPSRWFCDLGTRPFSIWMVLADRLNRVELSYCVLVTMEIQPAPPVKNCRWQARRSDEPLHTGALPFKLRRPLADAREAGARPPYGRRDASTAPKPKNLCAFDEPACGRRRRLFVGTASASLKRKPAATFNTGTQVHVAVDCRSELRPKRVKKSVRTNAKASGQTHRVFFQENIGIDTCSTVGREFVSLFKETN